MFVKLERPDGQPLIVNSSLVLTVTDGNGVTVRMQNGDFHTVKGTLDEVADKLNKAHPA